MIQDSYRLYLWTSLNVTEPATYLDAYSVRTGTYSNNIQEVTREEAMLVSKFVSYLQENGVDVNFRPFMATGCVGYVLQVGRLKTLEACRYMGGGCLQDNRKYMRRFDMSRLPKVVQVAIFGF